MILLGISMLFFILAFVFAAIYSFYTRRSKYPLITNCSLIGIAGMVLVVLQFVIQVMILTFNLCKVSFQQKNVYHICLEEMCTKRFCTIFIWLQYLINAANRASSFHYQRCNFSPRVCLDYMPPILGRVIFHQNSYNLGMLKFEVLCQGGNNLLT